MRKWSPRKIITVVVSAALLGGTVYYATGFDLGFGFDPGSGDLRPSSPPTVENQPNVVATSKQADPVEPISKAPPEPTTSTAPQVTSVREVSPTKKVLEETPYKRRTIATDSAPGAATATEADDSAEVANSERATEALTTARPSTVAPTLAPTPAPTPEPLAAVKPESSPTPIAQYFQRVWFWLGAGMNFTSYSQTVPGLSDVSYGNMQGPSLTARAGSMINERWGMDLGYKETPGEVQSSSSITVLGGNYKWRTLSVEGIYSLTKPSESQFEDGSFALKFGFQQHQMPFMVPIAANTIDVRQNNLTMATAGFEYVIFPRRRLRWEILARYQHPIQASASSGASVSVNPKFAVDGSLGQVFRINDQWSLGAFWYGQWHSYSFDYSDSSSSTQFNGNQTLFYSTIDMRIGFEF